MKTKPNAKAEIIASDPMIRKECTREQIKRLHPLITGNVGLYYTCYRLSRLGWNVMPTSRNARGVDIVAYDETATHFVGLQVKTLSKRAPVPLGISIENLMGDFWIILNDAAKEPKAYIMTPEEIYSRAHRGEKNGNISHWLQPKSYETPEFLEAWHRIKLRCGE